MLMLTAEKGINVQKLDLTGRSDLAHWMVFATGRSVPHMRNLAKMVARTVRDLPCCCPVGIMACGTRLCACVCCVVGGAHFLSGN